MIQEYFSQKSLVERVLSMDEMIKLSQKSGEINIIMGQTFDSGQPVDMMKYGLFIMGLEDLLSKKNSKVNSMWLIADHFMTNINEDKEIEEARKQVVNRENYLGKLNKVYKGRIKIILSSNLSQTPDYKENLKRLKEEAGKNLSFRRKVLESVPEDRKTNKKSINYPLEELAAIQSLKTSIKIGPKYEFFYDRPARDFASDIGFEKYIAVHLTNCFPFGNPKISNELKKEIEKFGILPYKKNSKGLGEYRIDPINDSLEKIEDLIKSTRDPRAIKDLIVITELAKKRLEQKDLFFTSEKEINLRKMKDKAIYQYKKYIEEPFNNAK